MDSENNYNKILFFTLIVILIAQRFFHFQNVIEEPMAWRQFDTEFFAYDFYKHGINLFKPSVSWMGGYRTTILEFPLISAIISIFYIIFEPATLYARLTIYIFFIGSAIYLYKLFLKLYYRSLAATALIVYLLLPISLYYSRAVNIDFAVMFFALSALYYFVLGFENEKFMYIIPGVLLSTLGFLVKAPYMLIIYFPLIYYIFHKNKVSFALKVIPLMLIPAISFYFWQKYSIKINNNAPDWYFIPDYFKFTDMSSWYFGSISQRFEIGKWELLLSRFGASGITFIGFPLFLTGAIFKLKNGFNKNIIYYYSIGSIIYILIFFNLNVIHNYYQVPLLVATSFFIAAGIDHINRYLSSRLKITGKAIITFIIVALTINGIWFTERWYYKPDKIRNSAADFINKNTGENDLVIASVDLTDPRDPRILAPSHRYGWAIRLSDLKPELIEKLKLEGATYLSVTGPVLNDSLNNYLGNFTLQRLETGNEKSNTILYKIK